MEIEHVEIFLTFLSAAAIEGLTNSKFHQKTALAFSFFLSRKITINKTQK